MAELEVKLGLNPEALERWRQRMHHADARSERFVARYFNTPSGHLARAGISLRLRSEGRRWVQTVKVQEQLSVQRYEHEVAVEAEPGREPLLDLNLHAGTEAGKCLAAALGDHLAQLSEQYASDEERLHHVFPAGAGGAVEVALDVGEVRANTAREALAELELELKQGPPEALFDMASQTMEAGGLRRAVERHARSSAAHTGTRRAHGIRSSNLRTPAAQSWPRGSQRVESKHRPALTTPPQQVQPGPGYLRQRH
ncbi:CYTH domain-containing protein [Aquincola sp. J276]|nr:CYTH domain-containing protein [Aquincola sp. J276]MCR5868173.1 CYTH domain-containing protein [Aquincola sp. J276]